MESLMMSLSTLSGKKSVVIELISTYIIKPFLGNPRHSKPEFNHRKKFQYKENLINTNMLEILVVETVECEELF